jgi:hypothetical protein
MISLNLDDPRGFLNKWCRILKNWANEIGREKTGEEKMGLFLRSFFLTRRLLKNPKTFNK